MEKLRTAERWLSNAEKGLLLVLVVVMVGLSFLQVVLRSFFSGGILWADTFLRHLVLWAGFLGAMVAATENKQFAMDAAARVLKGRVKAAVEALTCAFTAAVCVLLSRASMKFFWMEYESHSELFTVGKTQVPAWIFEVILPLGFALLALHYLLKLAMAAIDLIHPPPVAAGGKEPGTPDEKGADA